MTTLNQRMFQRRDTTADWTAADPILGAGELAVELDDVDGEVIGVRVGDGTNHWSDLIELVATATSYDDRIETLEAVELNVLDFGALGDGSTDDSAAVTAALTAMPSTGGTLVFPPQKTYRLGNVTLPERQNVKIIGSPSAVLKKNANGPMFTVPGGGWSNHLTFEGVAIDGNGANYTGVGISITGGGYVKFRGGRIMDTASHCVDYTVDGAGQQGGIESTILSVYHGGRGEASATVGCIKLPNDITQ